ncbi:MAG: NAD(P)H-hydrate dehydratase [Bacteroidales bacterium]|nr:NAD(P)H-hydrate dehydratase [Bacteroidales bacterium]
MKILSAQQTRLADAATISNQHITSEELMERAGNALASEIRRLIDHKQPVKIFCGPGNNGGDGLVIARLLFNSGYDVEAYYIKSSRYSADFEANRAKLSRCDSNIIHPIEFPEDMPSLPPSCAIVDALFGSGLNRRIEGISEYVIKKINAAKALVIAVDTPSGLADYDIPDENNAVIQASHTLAIQIPFVSMLLPENYRYTGDVKTVNINLDQEFINQTDTPFSLYDADSARYVLPPRPKFAHKGTFGHSLIIAGSYGKAGAAVLACKACHRTGTGLLTVHVPKKCVDIIQTATPETMVSIDDSDERFENVPDIDKYSAIGMGPGIGTEPYTPDAIIKTLKKAREQSKPVVIDADALNILGCNNYILSQLPPMSILTPHVKEFDRVFGESKNNLERIEKIRHNTKLYSIIIVLKGAYSVVGLPDGTLSFNTTGNPAMATAGSGDVLTGIITALLAQKLSSEDAARYGVYIHGAAGDIAAKEIGNCGITAQDIIKYIPQAVENTKKPAIPF